MLLSSHFVPEDIYMVCTSFISRKAEIMSSGRSSTQYYERRKKSHLDVDADEGSSEMFLCEGQQEKKPIGIFQGAVCTSIQKLKKRKKSTLSHQVKMMTWRMRLTESLLGHLGELLLMTKMKSWKEMMM
jgi:hypothetical protein